MPACRRSSDTSCRLRRARRSLRRQGALAAAVRPELLALLLARRGDLLELLDLGDKVLLLTRHVFEEHELLLKVFAYVLLPQDLQELLDLDLLREGNASQLLDVLLAPQVHERAGEFCFGVVDPLRAFFYRPRAVGSITAGDRARRPTSSQPFDQEGGLARRQMHDRALLLPW